jgi:hypothetical protein
MSDMSHKIYIFSLKSVGRLVRCSPLLTLSPKSPGFKPQTGRKEEQKFKFYQAIRNQDQIFNGFNPESTIETSDQNFARDFEWPKLRVFKKTFEIPPEVSIERKPEKFSKFQAKINYCVLLSQHAVHANKTLHVLLDTLRALTAFLTENRYAADACVLSHIVLKWLSIYAGHACGYTQARLHLLDGLGRAGTNTMKAHSI